MIVDLTKKNILNFDEIRGSRINLTAKNILKSVFFKSLSDFFEILKEDREKN